MAISRNQFDKRKNMISIDNDGMACPSLSSIFFYIVIENIMMIMTICRGLVFIVWIELCHSFLSFFFDEIDSIEQKKPSYGTMRKEYIEH